LGLRPRRCGSELPSRARHGGGIGEFSLDLHSGSFDLEPPVVGGFGCWWRMLRLGLFSISADPGGRGWRRRPLPLSIGAAGLLLPTFMPAGRGGEGFGVRSGVFAAGGYSRPFLSNGSRVAEMSGEVAPAWCRGLPGSDIEAPSPNKLEAGRIKDLGLKSPAASSSSPPQASLYVASALPACRGGKGKSGDNMPQPWWSPWTREVEGIPSPGVVTLPTRGPVLPATPGRKGASYPGGMPEHSPVGRFLLHAAILCLPPPIRGRF
jgi:hypothetical protein